MLPNSLHLQTSRGWMLTAYWKCLVHELAPKLCQGINCFGELLLAKAKNKPRARLAIQQYWLPSGSAWDSFLALPHCFCRCDLHTEKCTSGVAARMMGALLIMSSSNPPFSMGCPHSPALWLLSSSGTTEATGRLPAPARWVTGEGQGLCATAVGETGLSNGDMKWDPAGRVSCSVPERWKISCRMWMHN